MIGTGAIICKETKLAETNQNIEGIFVEMTGRLDQGQEFLEPCHVHPST